MLKRLLIVCLVLNANWAWSQVPRNGSQKNHPTQSKKNNAKPIQPSASAIQVETSSAKQEQKADSESSGYPWGELLAPANIPNWFLVGVGFWAGLMALRTLREMGREIGHIESQTQILRDSVAAAQKSADAAEISAKAAMGTAIPTLMLSQFEFIPREHLSWEQRLQCPSLVIAVKNYGNSPAILKSYAVQFTCEDPPSIPDYPPELYFEVGTTVERGVPIPLEGKDGVTPWGTFSLEDARAILRGEKYLSVYGYVRYGDVFGPTTHEMRFCKMCGGFPDEIFWIDWPSPYAKD